MVHGWKACAPKETDQSSFIKSGPFDQRFKSSCGSQELAEDALTSKTLRSRMIRAANAASSLMR